MIFCNFQISALFNRHQRGFPQQHMGTNTENHSQTLCREIERESKFEESIKSFLPELRESHGREGRGIVIAR